MIKLRRKKSLKIRRNKCRRGLNHTVPLWLGLKRLTLEMCVGTPIATLSSSVQTESLCPTACLIDSSFYRALLRFLLCLLCCTGMRLSKLFFSVWVSACVLSVRVCHDPTSLNIRASNVRRYCRIERPWLRFNSPCLYMQTFCGNFIVSGTPSFLVKTAKV